MNECLGHKISVAYSFLIPNGVRISLFIEISKIVEKYHILLTHYHACYFLHLLNSILVLPSK